MQLALAPKAADESPGAQTASLFEEPSLSPHERKIYRVLKADESVFLGEIIEKLEAELSSSEIFAALFELELAGKIKQLSGKNFCEGLLKELIFSSRLHIANLWVLTGSC